MIDKHTQTSDNNTQAKTQQSVSARCANVAIPYEHFSIPLMNEATVNKMTICDRNPYDSRGAMLSFARNAQEPTGESTEDQAEGQGLPEMSVCHAGGHHRVWEKQHGRPSREEDGHGKGRFPSSSAKHANKRI
jgi:hypothetical protein